MTTTTSLATTQQSTGEVLPFVPTNFSETLALASHLARSGLIPESLRGKPQDVAVVVMTGHEMGLSPLQSLRMISVIRGKPVMDASLIVAQCLRANDVCAYFALISSDDTQATYETQRVGSPKPTAMSYTFEQAKKARLTNKENWQTYPAAMLRARCSAALARAVYPDLVAGIYDHDELEPEPAQRAQKTPRVVQAIPESAPRVESSSAAPAQPVPQPVEDAQIVPAPAATVVHEAHAPTTVPPEPPPPTEPGANDVSACEELLGLLGSIPAREWLQRKNAAQAKKQLTDEDVETLRAAYNARVKNGGK
jgi:hypothetical protein